jgi:hypothetical protein
MSEVTHLYDLSQVPMIKTVMGDDRFNHRYLG